MRRIIIKRKLIILTMLLLILWMFPGKLIANDWDEDKCIKEFYDEKVEAKFEKVIDLAKNGHIYLENISGDIEVETWDQNKVKIVALKVSRASSSARAKENLERVKIEVEKVGKTLRIETKYPKRLDKWLSGSVNVSVNYRLWIPEQASVELKSVSGDIEAEKIGGLFEASSVSGDVIINKAQRGVDISSVSGDLELDDITGDASLETVSGEITLDRIKGSIEAETVSGEIELRDVSMARDVEAKTVSGDISYDGDINPRGRYELNTHSGDIEMVIPADAGFELEAETYSGHIDCDFEVTMSGRIRTREIHGVVNDGGAILRLHTFSGSISLEKR